MRQGIIPDQLRRQEVHECEACGAEKRGSEACYLVGRSIRGPPTDTIIEGDKRLDLEILCTECLATLNDHLETWIDSKTTLERDRNPITEEESIEFLDLLEEHPDLKMIIRSGLELWYDGVDDEFIVYEMRLPAEPRVEAVDRDELISEITKQVDIEVSRINERKSILRFLDRYQ